MSTDTIESMGQTPANASEAGGTPLTALPDPDRPIESPGGPSDAGNGGHTGSNPPPAPV